MSEKKICTTNAELELLSNSIVYVKLNEKAYETYETLEENALAILEIANSEGGNLVVMDVCGSVGVSKEARKLAKSKKYMYVYKAVAIVVGNVLTRMLASFFVGFSEPGFPVKIFDNKESAIKWLKTL